MGILGAGGLLYSIKEEILYVLFTVVHVVPRINTYDAEGAIQILVE